MKLNKRKWFKKQLIYFEIRAYYGDARNCEILSYNPFSFHQVSCTLFDSDSSEIQATKRWFLDINNPMKIFFEARKLKFRTKNKIPRITVHYTKYNDRIK